MDTQHVYSENIMAESLASVNTFFLCLNDKGLLRFREEKG